MRLVLDHLVIAARTLDDGVAWCEATLGITPGPGGAHDAMGTHNRVSRIAKPAFPLAYMEIIATDPQAPLPARIRWFDLDSPGLQAALRREPRLIAWVARCDDLAAATATLRAHGIDAGDLLQAERRAAQGLLRWRVGVRADGQRLFGGAVPTLIEWGELHPVDAMPASGVTLEQVTLGGLPVGLEAAMPEAVAIDRHSRASPISVVLATPLGRIGLTSPYHRA